MSELALPCFLTLLVLLAALRLAAMLLTALLQAAAAFCSLVIWSVFCVELVQAAAYRRVMEVPERQPNHRFLQLETVLFPMFPNVVVFPIMAFVIVNLPLFLPNSGLALRVQEQRDIPVVILSVTWGGLGQATQGRRLMEAPEGRPNHREQLVVVLVLVKQ